MRNKSVYLGELWCYLHLDTNHIEKTWFGKYHAVVFGAVVPSWPDEVFDGALDENTARSLDAIAEEIGYGGGIVPIINGEAHLLVVDFCVICARVTLLSENMCCYRCGQLGHR